MPRIAWLRRCFRSRCSAAPRHASCWTASRHRRLSRQMESTWRSYAPCRMENKSLLSPTRTARISALLHRGQSRTSTCKHRSPGLPTGAHCGLRGRNAKAEEPDRARERRHRQGTSVQRSTVRFRGAARVAQQRQRTGVRRHRAVRRTLELEQPALVDRLPGRHNSKDHSRRRELWERRRNRGGSNAGRRAG